jgi:hypothetical protein
MIGQLHFVLAVLASPFQSKLRLEAENAVLRHQLIVLRRRLQGRVRLTNHDRWFFIQLYRWFPSILEVLTIIRTETVVRWHRAGFRGYWRWKSRPLGGRPPIDCPCRKPHLAGERPRIGRCCCVMRDLCRLISWMVVDLFRSRVVPTANQIRPYW